MNPFCSEDMKMERASEESPTKPIKRAKKHSDSSIKWENSQNRQKSLMKSDLSQHNLSLKDFAGSDLRGSNFAYYSLENVNLCNTNLLNTTFGLKRIMVGHWKDVHAVAVSSDGRYIVCLLYTSDAADE